MCKPGDPGRIWRLSQGHVGFTSHSCAVNVANFACDTSEILAMDYISGLDAYHSLCTMTPALLVLMAFGVAPGWMALMVCKPALALPTEGLKLLLMAYEPLTDRTSRSEPTSVHVPFLYAAGMTYRRPLQCSW